MKKRFPTSSWARQPRTRCWARARSSSSELVETATARRRRRVEDATRVGLQFPFPQNGEAGEAPSVAMKCRDAVKSAIMHGRLPLGVTLEAPCWWRLGMPQLPAADHMAPVPLKRRRDTSAEPKTDTAKRAYVRIPDETKLWFVDLHAYHARVHGERLAYNIRQSKHLVPSSLGPWHPTRSKGGTTAAHPMQPADRPWSCHHSAFPRLACCRQSQRPHFGSTSTAVCCASSISNSSPLDIGTRQFLRSLQLSWKLATTSTRHRPSEADIARERKLLQLRVIYLCDRFGISQDRKRNLDETAVRMVPTGERGWTKKPSQHGMWTQIVCERKTHRVHPHGPLFPRQLVYHSPTHWITQDALLDMIDAIDTDMHARAGDAELIPWLPGPGLCTTALFLCATQRQRCCHVGGHPFHLPCVSVVSVLHVFHQFHRLHSERGQMTNGDGNQCCPSFGGLNTSGRRVLRGS